MKANNQELYNHEKELNNDPYGTAIFVYAERWANIMELMLERGQPLTETWEATSHDADTDGITGNMYGEAVCILVKHWKHGDELRKLHNASFGHMGDGVVNPAVIIADAKDMDDLIDKIKDVNYA